MNDINDKLFKKHKIVPDVISRAPQSILKVTYAVNIQVEQGNILTPTQVKNAPNVEWESEDNALYTLIMIDPDAPSRKSPKYREWQHWLVVNIPGNNIAKGQLMTDYVGSAPPRDTGLHRYVFLLYKQPNVLDLDEPTVSKTTGKHRCLFKSKKFATKYELGDPIAANFFQAAWDDYVPSVYKQLSE